MTIARKLLCGAGLSALALAPAARAETPAKIDTAKYRQAMQRGWEHLVKTQAADGSWGMMRPKEKGGEPQYVPDVGITGICVYALAKCPDRKSLQGAIDKGVAHLMKSRREDGAFADADGMLVNYKTSVAILALAEVDPAKYRADVAKAKDVIVRSIAVNSSDVRTFGGAGYAPDQREKGADLNNTVFAAEALKRAEEIGVQVDPAVYKAMEKFVSRVQNLEKSNDILNQLNRAVRAEDEGGFAYRPEESKANEGKPIVLPDGRKVYPSYGSMTYAGLLSFIYANVAKDDLRVKAAWNWAGKHYTLDENPGMAVPNTPAKGGEGLYYYYHTLAKAASHFGQAVLEDAKGNKHDWARELGDKLAATQRKDGSWVNPADRWYEGWTPLVTSYEILALDYCVKELEKRK